MVLPIKIFEIQEEKDLNFIMLKLNNFREEENYEKQNGENITLLSEVLDLKFINNSIYGAFSKDFIEVKYYRRQMIENLVTEEASFWIKKFDNRTFLFVNAPSVARGVKKLLTGTIANKLSRFLFIKPYSILEAEITHDTLKELHESNPQATKLIWFDQIDIPGVEKLCLAGSSLVDSEIYKNYLKHGKIWYVVFEENRNKIVIGITRNCVITLFSKSSLENFINFLS